MPITLGSSLKKANPAVPYIVDDQEIKGGFRCVASITERDAIPIGGRRGGMVVRVVSGTTFTDYTLPGDNLSNSAWFEQKAASSGGTGGTGDYVPTAGGTMNGELKISDSGSLNIGDLATVAKDGTSNVKYTAKNASHTLAFNNGAENTIEIDVSTGQIVAKREVALASDASLKENVKTIQDSLVYTEQLRGVTFDWISDSSKSMGVIADELKTVFPYLVRTGEDGKLSVCYTALIGLLIENIKELNHRISSQDIAIAELKLALEAMGA